MSKREYNSIVYGPIVFFLCQGLVVFICIITLYGARPEKQKQILKLAGP